MGNAPCLSKRGEEYAENTSGRPPDAGVDGTASSRRRADDVDLMMPCCSERESGPTLTPREFPNPTNTPVVRRTRSVAKASVLCASEKAGGRIVFYRKRARLHDFDFEPVKDTDGGDTQLGEGTSGRVRLVCDRHAMQKRALKVVRARPGEEGRLRCELEAMARMDHPNIVRLFDAFEDGGTMELVCEYCSGGDLMARLTEAPAKPDWTQGIGYNRLGARRAAGLLRQVLGAVAHVHAHGLVHRDVKPENFVFSSPLEGAPLKLIDFGIAAQATLNSATRMTDLGSPDYAAPEVLTACLLRDGVRYDEDDADGPQPASAQSEPLTVDNACDLWSVGVMMHLMLTGSMPKSANRRIFIVHPEEYLVKQTAILSSDTPCFDLTAPEWERQSWKCKTLMSSLLRVEPSKRPTAVEVLKSSWFDDTEDGDPMELTAALAEKLVVFSRCSPLRQAALSLLVDRMYPPNEPVLMRQIWSRLNKDRDGFVSVRNVEDDLLQRKVQPVRGLHAALMSLAGADGHLMQNQFLAATMDQSLLRKRRFAKAVFCTLDLDGNGRLEAEELSKVLGDNCGVGGGGLGEEPFYSLICPTGNELNKQ